MQEGNRVKDAAHALAILASLRSQKLSNDLTDVYNTLCFLWGRGTFHSYAQSCMVDHKLEMFFKFS